MGSLTGCIKKAGSALRAEDREAILAAFNDATAKGVKAADAARQAVDARMAEVRALLEGVQASVEPPTTTSTTAAKGVEQAEPASIQDVGEKIGGARKDTAVSTGTTRRKSDDDRPAWARRFQVSEIITPGGMLGEVKDAGRWIIRDTKSL